MNNSSMINVLTIASAIITLLLPAVSVGGQFREPGTPPFGSQRQANDKVRVTVMLDTDRVEPLKTFHLVILFEIQDNWHLYWKNPGAGAAPIEVEVKGPTAFEISAVRWPRPEIFKSNIGDMYGYEKQIALFVPITPSEFFTADAAMLRYDIVWAVCDDQRCLLQSKQGSVTVNSAPLLQQDEQAEHRQSIETNRKRLPTLADDDDEVTVTLDGSSLTIVGPAHGFDAVSLLPDNSPGVEFGSPDIDVKDDQFEITVEVIMNPRNFAGTKPQAGGLVMLGEDVTDPSFEFALALGE